MHREKEVMRGGVAVALFLLLPAIVAAQVAIDYQGQTDPNNALPQRNSTYLNLSIVNETDIHSVTLEWNDANYTIFGEQLRGNWHLDNRTNDSSYNYLNGSVSGGVNCRTDVEGVFGTGCNFSNSGEVGFGEIPAMTLTDRLSVEFWIKPTATLDSSSSRTDIVTKRNNWWFNYNDYGPQNGQGLLEFNADFDNVNSTIYPIDLEAGSWYYIVGTYDTSDNNISLYINGQYVNSSLDNNEPLGGHPIEFASSSGNDNYYNGIIDEVRLWHKVLTPEEINFLYRSVIDKNYVNVTNLNFTQQTYNVYINLSDGSTNTTHARNITQSNGSILSCGVLVSSARYYLESNLSSNAGCLNVTTIDVTLDGAAYNVSYAHASPGEAVYVTANNTIITNFSLISLGNDAIADSDALRIVSSNNTNIFNNTIRVDGPAGSSSNSDGVSITSSSEFAIVANNTIYALDGRTASGIHLNSDNNTIELNYVENTGDTFGTGFAAAIRISSSAQTNTIRFNTLNASSGTAHVIAIDSGDDNIFVNNTIHSNSADYSIELTGAANNNTFVNNSILRTRTDFSIFEFADSTSDPAGTLVYNNIINTTANNWVSSTTPATVNNLSLTVTQTSANIIGGTILGGNYWANSTATGYSQTCTDANTDGICDAAFEFSNGYADFYPLTVPTDPANTSITYPFAFTTLTSTNFTLNYTANNSDGDSLTYYIYTNEEFNHTATSNTTLNFSSGTIAINVSAYDGRNWGPNSSVTIRADDTQPYDVIGCQNLSRADSTYQLVNHVSSTWTCFRILANNITIDGQNFNITYSTSDIGYGINNTGFSEMSVRNVTIFQASTQGASDGLHVTGANAKIYNLSIRTQGIGSEGIYLSSSANNALVDRATITTTANFARGIISEENIGLNITSSWINVSGQQTDGVFLDGSVGGSEPMNVIIRSNTVYFGGVSFNTRGVTQVQGINVRYDNNTIQAQTSATGSHAIDVVGTLGGPLFVENNTLIGDDLALWVEDAPKNVTVTGNSLWGLTSHTLSINANRESNITIRNNNFTTRATGLASVLITTGLGVLIENNNITSFAANSVGLKLEDTNQSTIANNTFKISDSGMPAVYTTNETTLLPGGHVIYNNLFNVTGNTWVGANTNYAGNSSLNVSRSGTNIIGGSSIGGNYYANDSHTGYSQTCSDTDYNGFCDSPLTFNSVNVDYLPLTQVIDTTLPNVSIFSPTTTNQTNSFMINVSANDTQTNVNVTVQFLQPESVATTIPLNLTSGSLLEGEFGILFDPTTIPEGAYNLSANATDAVGNTNISQNVSIFIDYTAPNATIVAPTNTTTILTSTALINASVNDSTSGVDEVWYRFISPSEETAFQQAALSTGTSNNGYWTATIDVSSLSGDYNITINATDVTGSSTIANISEVTISTDSLPVVFITNPLNDSLVILHNSTLNYTTTNTENDVLTYYIYLDGEFNHTTTTNTTFNLSNGYYHFNISAHDGTGFGGNSSMRFYVNDSGINVSFVPPTDADNAQVVRNWTFINVSVNNNTVVENATLTWNGTNVTLWGSGIVGYWNFDNNTNNSMDAAFHGTNNGANCSTSIPGRIGGACEFNNNTGDYIDMGDIPTSDQFSVCAWFNAESYSSNDTRMIVLKRNIGTLHNDNEWQLGVGPNGQYVRYIDYSSDAEDIDMRSTTAVSANRWYHVCVVRNGNGVAGELYLDGIINNNTVVSTGTLDATSSSLQIGARSADIDDRYWDGRIDEVNVWSRNLSAADVTLLYRTQLGRYYANITENTYDTNVSYQVHISLSSGTANSTEVRNLTFVRPNVLPNITILYPTDGAILVQNNVSLNYSHNDSEGDSVTYYIYVDETFSHTATTNTTINITEGQHTINVSANDGRGFGQNSSITITINALSPNVSIVRPLSGNYSSSLLINVSVNDSLTDVANVNVTFLQPGSASTPVAVNLTSGTLQSGYRTTTYDTTSLADGLYNLSANATDFGGIQVLSENVSIVIDNTQPNATIVEPENATSVVSALLLINASVNDTTSGVESVQYRVINSDQSTAWQSAALTTGTISQGYWTTTINVGGFTSVSNITINATDFSGISTIANISNVSISVDLTPPAFYNNDTNTTLLHSSDVAGLVINWSDGGILDTATIEHNFSGTLTNETHAISGTDYNITFNITVGVAKNQDIQFRFFGNDTSGNSNNTAVRVLTVVNSLPSVAIVHPSNNEYFFTSNVSLNYTATDADGDGLTYYTYVDGEFNHTTSTNTTFNFTLGTHTINVSAYDGEGFSSNATVTIFIATADCTISNSRIINTSITTEDGLTNCVIRDSTIEHANITSANIQNSLVSGGSLLDSIISNSTLTNAIVRYSRIENSTTCDAGFNFFEAAALNNTLTEGTLSYNGNNYFAPFSFENICGGVAPRPVGSLSVNATRFANNDSILFTYQVFEVGFNATINSGELAKFDNTSTTTLPLLDNGAGADDTANDGIYKATYSISPLNNISDGSYTVYAIIYDTVGNTWNVSTTVVLDNSGNVSSTDDATAPNTPTVRDDGTYTNTNAALHAVWNSTDEDQALPLEYEYRIRYNATSTASGNGYLTGWTFVGTQNEITLHSLSLTQGLNYTFEVRAINEGGLRSGIGESDGIIVDTTPPELPNVTSTHAQGVWSSSSSAIMNFSSTDSISNVSAFSYSVTSSATTIPDSIPETETEHELLASAANNGDAFVLKYNNSQNASAVIMQIEQPLNSGDVLRVEASLAETHIETSQLMSLRVYATNTTPSDYDEVLNNISEIVDTELSVRHTADVRDARSYTIDVPVVQNTSVFYLVIAGLGNDSNLYNLVIGADNSSTTGVSYYCTQGGSCSSGNTTFAVNVYNRDVKSDGVWDKTVVLRDGINYFHVRAQDKAGNFGNTTHYQLNVDASAPSTPQLYNPVNRTSGVTSLTFNWTQSQDPHSGVSNYFLIVDNSSDFSTPEFSQFVGNVTSRVVNNLDVDTTYYAKVLSQNQAGVNSSYSNEVSQDIDTTAPTILFSKPSGTIVRNNARIVIVTDEQATCSGRQGVSAFTEFEHTNSTVHETRVDLSGDFDVQCADDVNNVASTTLPVTVNTGASVNTITLPSITTFTGLLTKVNVTLSQGATPLGEYRSNDFTVTLNDEEIDFTIFDQGAGVYTLAFIAPVIVETYELGVSVAAVSSTSSLNVQGLSLVVQYESNDVTSESDSKLIFIPNSDAHIGLASDSRSVTTASSSSAINLTADANEGDVFIFVTRPTNVRRVLDLLRERSFSDVPNPSFGYATSDNTFIVYTDLQYDDVALTGNETIRAGSFNLVITNEGFDTTVNKTRLRVTIT